MAPSLLVTLCYVLGMPQGRVFRGWAEGHGRSGQGVSIHAFIWPHGHGCLRMGYGQDVVMMSGNRPLKDKEDMP